MNYSRCLPLRMNGSASHVASIWNGIFRTVLAAWMESTLSCKHQSIQEAFISTIKRRIALFYLPSLMPTTNSFFVDVGCNGRISDGGVFSRCALSSALENNTLSFPALVPLPGTDTILPHVVVADDAFPLRKNIMKPFSTRNQPAPNRIFNYRLSRARRVVENTFGLLSQVFRIFRRPILLNPKKVETIVLATCVLHNFLLSKSSTVYAPPGFFDTEVEDGSLVPGTWRNESSLASSFFDLRQQGSNSHSLDAVDIRNEFKTYFVSSEGEVAWQYRHIWFGFACTSPDISVSWHFIEKKYLNRFNIRRANGAQVLHSYFLRKYMYIHLFDPMHLFSEFQSKNRFTSRKTFILQYQWNKFIQNTNYLK